MKPSHRKDVIIARIIFACICVALIALIAGIIIAVASRGKKTEVQTQEIPVETETENLNEIYLPQETQSVIEEDTYYRVKASSGVNFRSEAGATGEDTIIAKFEADTRVKFISEDNGWAQVEYEGQVGYISMEFLELVE